MKEKIIILVLVVLTLLSFILPAQLWTENYPADDAYFYMQVASHYHQGDGSTFHGITPTNGYHPLWMLGCRAATWLAGGVRSISLHLAVGLQQLLAWGGLAMLWGASRRLGLKGWPAALPVFAIFFLTRLYLSEAYINFFMVSLCLLIAVQDDLHLPGWMRLPLVGATAGLAFLARLDNAFFVAPLFVFTVLRSLPLQSIGASVKVFFSSSLRLSIPFLLVVLPYLDWNMNEFGHLMPISGAIKNAAGNGLGFHVEGISPLGFAFLAAAFFNLLYSLGHVGELRRYVLLTLSVSYILLISYLLFFTQHHTDWPWYYVTGSINAAICAVLLWDWLAPHLGAVGRRPKVLLYVALAAVLLVNAYSALRYRYPGLIYGTGSLAERWDGRLDARWQQRVGEELGKILPKDARLISYDWPGMVAWFSERAVLPPDGLINDFTYNDDLLKECAAGYLQKRGVDYWLGPVSAGATRDQPWYRVEYDENMAMLVWLSAPLYNKPAGAFEVQSSGIVCRFRDLINDPDLPDIALWKLEH